MEEFKKEILAKYFQGNCSPAEEQMAIKWIADDNSEFDVKAVMADLINNPDKTLLTKDQLRWSRSRILGNISGMLKINKRTKIRRIVFRAAALAASWIILFGLGLGLQRYYYAKANADAGYFVINAPAGSRSEVSLPDGSKVWLNASSQIKFSKNFESSIREVALIGEAYFDVAKRENIPFVVNTHDIKINVLGTAFNVRAYPEDQFIETTVERGLVTVERQSEGSGRQRKILLKHNQQVRFENTQAADLTENTDSTDLLEENNESNIGESKIYLNKSIETAKYTSWIQNILLFESEPMGNLAKILERRHSVSIEILDTNLRNRQFTGIFEKESIEQALSALQYAGKFYFSVDKDKIIIDSKPIQPKPAQTDNANVRAAQ
jgi:ferric-dicitrate binding protein FerR (iron transport regulator)